MSAHFEYAARFFVKRWAVEANRAGHRLAVSEAAVGREQPVGMPGRHFDTITEHRIVPDLERADPRRIAVAAFEFGDRAAAVAGSRAQHVEFGVIALGHEAALGRVERWAGDEGTAEFAGQHFMAAERRKQSFEEARPQCLS